MQNLVLPMGTGADGFYPVAIEHTGQFKYHLDQYLYRAGQAGNVVNGDVTKLTFSTWFRLTRFDYNPTFFAAYTNASNNTTIALTSANKIQIHHEDGGSADNVSYPALIRDPSHYYHLLVVMDTDQGVAADRCKVWLNGVLLTAESGQLQYQDSLEANEDSDIYVGRTPEGSVYYMDGHLAHTILLAGQALDETYFGEFVYQTWVHKLGTLPFQEAHDFHLAYQDDQNLGDDSSGQSGGDFTNYNAVEQSDDTPTLIWPVLNTHPFGNYAHDIRRAGKTFQSTVAAWRNAPFTIPIPKTGKWYFEGAESGVNTYTAIGLSDEHTARRTVYVGNVANGVGYRPSGDIDYFGSSETQQDSWTESDNKRGAVLYDADADTVQFYTSESDGTLTAQGPTYDMSGLEGDLRYFVAAAYGTGHWIVAYITDGEVYSVPAGAKTLSSENVDKANAFSIIDPSEGFWNPLWTGDNVSPRNITGANFNTQSNTLVWNKNRGNGINHFLFDTVRGAGAEKELQSDLAGQEGYANCAIYGYLSAFLSNGFTLTEGSSDFRYLNRTGDEYVAWVFNMIPKFGRSIKTWSGDSVAGRTVAHGLGDVLEMALVKSTAPSATVNWFVYHHLLHATASEDYYLILDVNNAKADNVGAWNDTKPDATNITLGNLINVNATGYDYVGYFFRSIEGYSKVGAWVGTGNADGPFIPLDFRLAYLLFKADYAANGWGIYDVARERFNLLDNYLKADTDDAESSGGYWEIDVYANGFKLRNADNGANRNNIRYPFYAIGEMPYPYCNAA